MGTLRKSRWGIGIVVVFALFVSVMLGVTGFLMSQDVNLVTEKYYEKELRYQERIQAMERTRALGSIVGIEMDREGLRIQFPRTVSQPEFAGRVVLYRPADRSADRLLAVSPDSIWQQRIATASLAPGLWRLQVQWTMHGVEYYLEQPLMVR